MLLSQKNELTFKKIHFTKFTGTDQAKFCEHELFFSKHELFSIINFCELLIKPIWQHCESTCCPEVLNIYEISRNMKRSREEDIEVERREKLSRTNLIW